MKRVLITGSSGFVGPYLTAELEKFGYDVFGLDRGGTKTDHHHVADISNAAHVASAITEIQPQFIFHLAGVSNPKFAESHAAEAYAVNVEGARNLLEAAATLANRPRILLVSSSYVYGAPEHLPIDETHPLHGVGVYADTRREGEALARNYYDTLPITIARSFNHTGPGQPEGFFVPRAVKQIVAVAHGRQREIQLGNIELKRDILDVRDVVRAYRLLIENEASGRTVNVCRGQSIALKKLVEYGTVLANLHNPPISLNQDHNPALDAPDIYGSYAALHTLTGWEPGITYEQMIGDIYTYWEKQI
ncbi:MAG TPA: GDP-mannose 4,6-dehydratase [Patescibacteria group bacterium]|nr:GDP-mannose 4,6-dehydratase [Patescibacteria group bacterium]